MICGELETISSNLALAICKKWVYNRGVIKPMT